MRTSIHEIWITSTWGDLLKTHAKQTISTQQIKYSIKTMLPFDIKQSFHGQYYLGKEKPLCRALQAQLLGNGSVIVRKNPRPKHQAVSARLDMKAGHQICGSRRRLQQPQLLPVVSEGPCEHLGLRRTLWTSWSQKDLVNILVSEGPCEHVRTCRLLPCLNKTHMHTVQRVTCRLLPCLNKTHMHTVQRVTCRVFPCLSKTHMHTVHRITCRVLPCLNKTHIQTACRDWGSLGSWGDICQMELCTHGPVCVWLNIQAVWGMAMAVAAGRTPMLSGRRKMTRAAGQQHAWRRQVLDQRASRHSGVTHTRMGVQEQVCCSHCIRVLHLACCITTLPESQDESVRRRQAEKSACARALFWAPTQKRGCMHCGTDPMWCQACPVIQCIS